MKDTKFIQSFEKVAAYKLPKLFTQATKNMNVKLPGFSKRGIRKMLRKRK